MWIAAASAYALLSRLAYVGWVGAALRRQDRRHPPDSREVAEARYWRFRRTASPIMANDTIAIVALCLISRGTLHWAIGEPALIAISLSLIVLGIGIKAWAARTLGDNAYYWYNFFVPDTGPLPAPSGPYRFLDNPMYTVGYAHAYGFALLTRSLPGLGAALFYHAAILTFHILIEAPHYRALTSSDRHD
jgi:protein-S-isoprenylcysteine O-methyltransferase Ste14